MLCLFLKIYFNGVHLYGELLKINYMTRKDDLRIMEKELQTIKTEEIQFYEDTLLGGTDEEGTIWLAVNQTCKSIGFDETDSENQARKMNKDEVLKTLSVKFYGTNSNRPMWFISEKGITIWLAKISITSNMKEKYPDLSNKLIKYQLECSEVLHNHFMSTQEKKEQFFNDTLNIDIKEIVSQNNFLISENKEIKEELHVLHGEFEGFKLFSEEQNKVLYTLVQRFNIYDNPSISYTRIIDDYNAKIYGVIRDKNKHKMFWEGICNWFGIDIDILYKQSNKKQWLLDNVGIEVLNYFCDNVILNKIKQNKQGNFINLNGYNSDPYNIEKNKILKHWTTKDGKLRCCYCGEIIENPIENENYNFEHYTAKTTSGSTNTIENLGVACCQCNKEKNTMTYEEFSKYKGTSKVFLNRKVEWDNKYKK